MKIVMRVRKFPHNSSNKCISLQNVPYINLDQVSSNMGIYTTLQLCGCEIESYLGYNSSSVCFPCVEHGGNPVAVAGRQAKRWTGPENPYADPEDPGMTGQKCH